jgi:hypothetical protein
LISASGGIFIPGNMGIGVDGYNVGLSSNRLTVFGNISSNGTLYTNEGNITGDLTVNGNISAKNIIHASTLSINSVQIRTITNC